MSRRPDERRVARATVAVLALFGAGGLALAGFGVLLWRGGQTQLEGILLGGALGLVALGLVLAAKLVVPSEEGEEERDPGPLPQPFEELRHGGERFGRKAFLGLVVAVPLGAGVVAGVLRLLGIGPDAVEARRTTAWGPGVRVVRPNGTPVRADEVSPGGMVTIFPEGATDREDSQANLFRVAADRLRLPPGREGTAPGGIVAYSRLCTHVGCPVALYQAEVERLVCPCHGATFDVLEAARPIFGPATRALPQLPLEVDDEGFLRAAGDFPEPVGPGFWELERAS